MTLKTTIRIRKRTQPGYLLRLLVLLPFFLNWLPGGMKYLLDAAWLILLIFLIRFWKSLDTGNVRGLMGWTAAFFALTLAVYLTRYQSALYYLWGFRNNFRFYAAFFAFSLFATQEDAAEYWALLDKLFWGNAFLSLIQYGLFGLRGDYLGGLFGVQQGCNGYTNIFFVMMVTKSVVFYLDGKERGSRCAAKCITALLIASLAELKFFFVEFAVIIMLAVLFSSFTWRKLWLILGGCVGVAVFAALLSALFPEFAGWFSPEQMLQIAGSEKGYSSAGDLNRLTAVSDINYRVFENRGQRLFGLGLGNCDYSGFDLLTTPFYRDYSYLHYTWMSFSFLYLETGALGLLFFFGFFALVFFRARRMDRCGTGVRRSFCRVSAILSICCIMIGVYNSSLRTEAGYLAYFAMALPFMPDRRVQ